MKTGKNRYNPKDMYERFERARKEAGYVNNQKLVDASDGKLLAGTISKWKNHNTIPGTDLLMTVCNLCDCHIDYLLGRIETFHIENHSIHEETGLSEKAIEILRQENQKDRDIKITLGIESIKLKLINHFILACDPIVRDIQRIESSDDYFEYCKDIGIDMEMVQKIYLSTQDTAKTPSENMSIFKTALFKKYPALSEQAAFDLYLKLATSHAVRFNMDQCFNKFIDDFLMTEQDEKDSLKEPIGE